MVEESTNGIECTKNRFSNRTMNGCKNVTFEKIELSKIDNDIHHIRKEYYGRNLFLVHSIPFDDSSTITEVTFRKCLIFCVSSYVILFTSFTMKAIFLSCHKYYISD